MRLDKEEIADVRAIVCEVLRQRGLETRPTFEDAAHTAEEIARGVINLTDGTVSQLATARVVANSMKTILDQLEVMRAHRRDPA